jgi:hypothetical protein
MGAGRSGSLLAETLAREGVGSLSLLDADAVEEGNLHAMFGVTSAEVGRPKVEAVARWLRVLRPDLELVTGKDWAQSRRGIDILRAADLIVTTVDADAGRLAASMVANAYLIPHLDIGTGIHRAGVDQAGGAANRERRMGADVRLLLPGDGCVLCAGGIPDEPAARAELLDPDLRLERLRATPWWRERAGSLAALNEIAVGRGLLLWFDFLTGRIHESRWDHLEIDEEGRLEHREIAVEARPECSVCGNPGEGDLRFGPVPQRGE